MATTFPFRALERASPPPEAIARVALFSADPDVAASIQHILEAHGYFVVLAKTPAAVLSITTSAAHEGVDAVLLDLGLLTANGPSPLWAEILAEPSSEPMRAPMILMLDADSLAQAVESAESGAFDFLVKPFSEAQLLFALRRAVEHRRLLAQNNLFRHHLEQLIAARTKMLQNTMHQLEQSYDVTLEALGNALDLKDAETEGHSKRVTAYTLALGRAVGLSETELRMVGRGAFLHDIGKMAIPDAILRKPGKLTAHEREIMRTHSELGYRMVQKIPFLREASEIVYAHQECYDGSGYPRGLRGEQIHIGARIFAVADTLDAITSNRPYRKASSIADARKEVLRCAGTQFDPAIVDVFMATPDALWQDLREGILREGSAFSPFGYTFGEMK